MNTPDGRSTIGVRRWRGAVLLAFLFLALHLPFLPASLEDLDSINFALGVRQFDVARHQPHPPGYPLYIAIGKLAHAVMPSEAHALSVLSIVAGSLGVLGVIALFRRLDLDGDDRRWPVAAACVAVTCPLYWFTAARPLSDVTGLAVALGVQAAVLSALTVPAIALASACAALAAGLRSQVMWLTVPLLVLAVARRPAVDRWRAGLIAMAAWVAGALVWAVPLILLTGGPTAYWQAVFNQGAEDLTGIRMLWTTPTPRQAALALYDAFVAPWAAWPMAAGVLIFAAIGFARMCRQQPRVDIPARGEPVEPRAKSLVLRHAQDERCVLERQTHDARPLATLAAAFGPYLVFDLLFQETVTTRYALPLVIPVAYLAARGAGVLPRRAALVLVLAAVVWNGAIAELDVRAYAAMPAPAFRLLAGMEAAPGVVGQPGFAPVLAMHRREDLDLRRPILWEADRMPRWSERFPAPPKHEWLELVKYWNRGGRAPIWFVADPLRSDLALVDRSAHRSYAWPLTFPVLLGGIRPDGVDWYTFDRPGWYLGEGWALTPETAGVALQDGRGPSVAPIQGWIRRRPDALTLLIGGRNLASTSGPVRMRVTIDGRAIDEPIVAPGFFLRMLDLPAHTLDGPGEYAMITVASERGNLAIEQFDAQSADRVVFGFGDGWHEQEYNPSTGVLWRWASERATIRVHDEGHALVLTVGGETPRFPAVPHVAVTVNDRLVSRFEAEASFAVEIPIPSTLMRKDSTITIETDQTYVPAERSRRSPDRRRLSLKVLQCTIRAAS